MHYRRYLQNILWVLVFIHSWACAANPTPVSEFTLKNGLKVWVKPDHRAPVVVSMLFYQVGSKDEPPGLTGIAHMLEHMMFKGTAQNPGQAFTRLISEKGGKENAFTNTDFTVYYEELSKNYLPLALSLEADRMQHLALNEADFLKERQVVKEERFMRTDDNPIMLAVERLNAAAYLNNPYHHPTVGWLSDLNQLTIQDVRAWYHAWYGPNNAVLVIVGDVDPQQVKTSVEKTFNSIKPIHLTPLKDLPDPPYLGTRHVDVSAPAQLPWIGLAYNVPSLKSATSAKEAYTLAVLSAILGEGDCSRLNKTIVRQTQIASQAETSYNLSAMLANVFMIDAVPAEHHTVAELQKALQAEVTKLQQQPISEAELARVKNAAIADRIYELDSLSDQAEELGLVAMLHFPWQMLDQIPKQIGAVTAADVQAVARKYLVPERLTIAELHPLSLPNGETPPPASGLMENNSHVH